MQKFRLIILNISISLFILSCVSLPEGLSTKSEIYNTDTVDFYY